MLLFFWTCLSAALFLYLVAALKTARNVLAFVGHVFGVQIVAPEPEFVDSDDEEVDELERDQ